MDSALEKIKSRAVGLGAKAYLYGRAAHYFSQLRTLQGMTKVLLSQEFPKRVEDPKIQRAVQRSLFELLNRDAEKFAQGVYPISMLKPGNPVSHWLRMGRLIGDGLRLQRQKKRGRTTEFSESAQEFVSEVPRYYRRNFHFQKDGYLSADSADLYEHQVEILFGGAADAMRRMILEPLTEAWGQTDGRGLRILELGSGTGRTSLLLRALFPKAHLTVSELSDPYLKVARRQLQGQDRVDFVQCAAEALPFRSEQFDAVVSVFLFHELPSEVRQKVVQESLRVLKVDGVLAAVDSLQKEDIPEWAPVLEQFPIDFHEPFYRNYTEEPLERLFSAEGAVGLKSQIGFVSKLVWSKKAVPSSSPSTA